MSEFSLSFMGYNRSQVDRLINQQAGQIQELTAKITKLEDELAYFKEVEGVLKDSLIDARMKGNEIIEESHGQAETLLEQTKEQINQYKEEVSQQGTIILQSGRKLRDELNLMKSNLKEIVQEFNQLIDETNLDEIFPQEADRLMTLTLDSFQEIPDPKLDKEQAFKPDTSLSEEEKENLQKLIQEVISNEASKQGEGQADHKMIDLRVVNNQ